ncbi:hypothetical protein BH23GEM9_BH23GEM9_13890 [soil metagenome]
MTKPKPEPEGVPGHLLPNEYTPPVDWLREVLEGPFPRDANGKPMAYDTETGEWVPMEDEPP